MFGVTENAMNRSARVLLVVTSIMGLAAWAQAAPFFGKKLAKNYELTEKNGPWMIMVASFYSRDEAHNDEAVAKARELVEELRSKRLPAYLYIRESNFDAKGEVKRRDKHGRFKQAKFRNFFYVAVLAGDFESLRDNAAQRLMAKIKAYQPQCLQDDRITLPPGAKGPLWRAFLTPNPLTVGKKGQNPKRLDPFVRKLNEGREFSLLECPAPISVVVATFSGASAFDLETFENLAKQNRLEQAAIDAEELVRALKMMRYDAYVFHDRDKSYVTVGSFHDVNDPRLLKTLRAFTAPKGAGGNPVPKTLKDPKTKQERWVFDPQPLPIRVPRL